MLSLYFVDLVDNAVCNLWNGTRKLNFLCIKMLFKSRAANIYLQRSKQLCDARFTFPIRPDVKKRVRYAKTLLKAALKTKSKRKKHAVLYKRQSDALSGSQPLVLHSNAFKMSCFKWLEKLIVSYKSFSLNITCPSSCDDLTDRSIIYREAVLDLRLIRMSLLERSTPRWHFVS